MEESRLRLELVQAEERLEIQTAVNESAGEELVPAPGAALYLGADADVVEYIQSLGEPTTMDEEGNLITWIEQMQSLELKLDGANRPSIEQAREQLEKALELDGEESVSIDTCSLERQLQAMRQTLSAISVSDESLNRVMEHLTTRIKEELGLSHTEPECSLWETVGSVQQGRLF
ncbi:MAG TPA: hypothetical protein DCY91_20975 [Cyanobacteria bacterium UBA11370]|nr:hypothetical protein [Cyanobacteria bacterium UBA11370]HBY76865.1 hypothetical protein [Cyanobacteria bacterium UBA11148]